MFFMILLSVLFKFFWIAKVVFIFFLYIFIVEISGVCVFFKHYMCVILQMVWL